MTLFKSFDKISKASWTEKSRQDLKGRPLSDLNFELWPNHITTPFHHSDDDRSLILPYTTVPSLGFHINIDEGSIANKIILEELSGGCSCLSISLSKIKSVDYNVLLKDVQVDLIKLRITNNGSVQTLNKLITYLNNQYALSELKNIIVVGTHDITLPFSKGNCSSLENAFNLKPFLFELLSKGMSFVTNASDKDVFIIQLPFDNDYFQNIIKVRVVRLLWANLCTALNQEMHIDSLVIDGVVDHSILKNDQYENMIALSQIGASMMSAGVNVIFLPPSDYFESNSDNPNTRRISRNIFHLLSLESHMDEVVDPASGSYFFDSETITLAEEIWSSFIKRDGDA